MLYLQTFLALGAVLGIVWVCYRGFLLLQDRLPGSMRPRRNIQVVERVALGDKRTLLLVEAGGKRFLLGSTPHQVSLVSALGEVEPSPAADGQGEFLSESPQSPDFRMALEERLQ